MNNIKVTLNLEPTEEYQKAKNDMLQAKQSMAKLSSQERQNLIFELFEAELVEILIKNTPFFR